MKPTIAFSSLLLGICVTHIANAQETLKLWENQSKPYYKENTLVEMEEKPWGTLCVTKVTEPTLTVHPARGLNTGVGVIIIPGGNYSMVAIQHEGSDVANLLAEHGITAAVLKYRLPDPRSSNQPELVPLADARRALKLLRRKAAQYGLNTNKVGVLGFSAGSHLATVVSLWNSDDPEENPNFSGLIYGVTNDSEENVKWLEESLYFRKLTSSERASHRLLDLVDGTTPPAFLVHAVDDDICKVEESTLYAQRMVDHKAPVELHLFPKGGHGFGVGRKADGTDQWPLLFATWLQRQ